MLQNAMPALLLLIMMLGIAWALHRFRRHLPGAATHAGPPMRVLGALAVGPQQRLLTVQVGEGDQRVCLVLGVAPGSVTALHQMPLADAAQTLEAIEPAAPGGFAARLAQLTRGSRHAT